MRVLASACRGILRGDPLGKTGWLALSVLVLALLAEVSAGEAPQPYGSTPRLVAGAPATTLRIRAQDPSAAFPLPQSNPVAALQAEPIGPRPVAGQVRPAAIPVAPAEESTAQVGGAGRAEPAASETMGAVPTPGQRPQSIPPRELPLQIEISVPSPQGAVVPNRLAEPMEPRPLAEQGSPAATPPSLSERLAIYASQGGRPEEPPGEVFVESDDPPRLLTAASSAQQSPTQPAPSAAPRPPAAGVANSGTVRIEQPFALVLINWRPRSDQTDPKQETIRLRDWTAKKSLRIVDQAPAGSAEAAPAAERYVEDQPAEETAASLRTDTAPVVVGDLLPSQPAEPMGEWRAKGRPKVAWTAQHAEPAAAPEATPAVAFSEPAAKPAMDLVVVDRATAPRPLVAVDSVPAAERPSLPRTAGTVTRARPVGQHAALAQVAVSEAPSAPASPPLNIGGGVIGHQAGTVQVVAGPVNGSTLVNGDDVQVAAVNGYECPADGDVCPRCGRRHGGNGCLCSTCDMMPHYPYADPLQGYYYFRPYHHSHVASQQQFVTRWGGDPRNPYANEVFKRVNAEYKAAHPTPPKEGE